MLDVLQGLALIGAGVSIILLLAEVKRLGKKLDNHERLIGQLMVRADKLQTST